MDAALRRERLDQLLRVLESIPSDRLDQDQWWSKCGTAGCVIGWCAQDQYFRSLGLGLVLSDPPSFGPSRLIPAFRGKSCGISALAEFFGITKGQADYLFSAQAYERKAPPSVLGKKAYHLSYKDNIRQRIRMVIDTLPVIAGEVEPVSPVPSPRATVAP